MAKLPQRKRNARRQMWLSEKALHIAKERKEKKQGRKRKIYLSECRVPENRKMRKEDLIK